MQEHDLPGLAAQVLGAAFVLALAFGAIAQRTHFCTMGAVADIVHLGDWGRMRMWMLAMAVALAGFNGMVALGWVEARHSLYAAPRLAWLSHLVGGLLFGLGMVLASGCGSKTLVRIGGGNLKSLVVFCVAALAAYATLRGVTAVLRVATIDRVAFDLHAGQDLPSLMAALGAASQDALALGAASQEALAVGAASAGSGVLGIAAREAWALALGLGLALALVAFVLARPEGRRADTWAGGVGIGVAVVALWWVSGRLGHLAEHPLTLEEAFVATASQRMESFTFVAPLAQSIDWLILFSDRSKVLTIGVVTTLGVVVGSTLAALASRTFRWEGFGGVEDTANHLVGALLMGVGGVTALGCTIGQGITGLSTLSLGSFVSLAGILGGAVLALRWQAWRLERSA
jgi:uncharacterized membrane protein YedE/YeeE